MPDTERRGGIDREARSHASEERLRLGEIAGGIATFEYEYAQPRLELERSSSGHFRIRQAEARPVGTKLYLSTMLQKFARRWRRPARARISTLSFASSIPTTACTGSRRTGRSVGESSQEFLRGAIYEITARKALEVRLLALNETLEARVGELRQEARYLEILNDTGVAVAAERDLTTLVQTVTDAGVRIESRRVRRLLLQRPEGGWRSLHSLHPVGRTAGSLRQIPDAAQHRYL